MNKDSYVKYNNRIKPLKFHSIQQALTNSPHRFDVVPSGRRCLAKGTMVATPFGPIAIENLRIGDKVIGYNEFGELEITEVVSIWDNGIREVVPLYSGDHHYLSATGKHKLWACHEYMYAKKGSHSIEKWGYKRREIDDISERYRIKKQYCFDLIGNEGKDVLEAYVLGALIGDGCSRDNKSTNGSHQLNLYISSGNNDVPEIISTILECKYERSEYNNTYKLIVGKGALEKVPFYKQWVSGRYAHEKIADWEEINTWNKQSALSFLAGIIDTDGSVYFKNASKKEVVINIGMQAKSVVDACCKIIFKYFQEYPGEHEDIREKYKNGNVYYARTKSNILAERIIGALSDLSLKCGSVDLSNLVKRNILSDRIGFKKGDPYLSETYDITVGNKTNLYILHEGGIVTSNSGKTEIVGKRRLVYRAVRGVPYPNPRYFVATPTREQTKRIYWEDLKTMTAPFQVKEPAESSLIIYLKGDREIHLLGMDKPERVEGSHWDGGVLDEYGNMKASVWPEHVRPALSTPGRGLPWCSFIGVPEGRNHYFDLAMKAEAEMKANGRFSEWGYFHWLSADVLDPREIASAKRDLDPQTYKQEYEGAFVDFQGRAYYTFSRDYNCEELWYDPDGDLIVCFDFNVEPGVASIIQEFPVDEDDPFNIFSEEEETVTCIIDEVYVPENSNTLIICDRIINKYRSHRGKVFAYGDASGGNRGSAKVLGSDWDLIDKKLIPVFGNRYENMSKRKNTSERSRVNAVNSRCRSMDGTIRLLLDSTKAPYTLKDFEGVILVKEGTGQIDKSDPRLTHLCFGAGVPIDTDKGIVNIKDLPSSGLIKTFDGSYVPYTNPGSRGFKDTVKLIFNTYHELVCTKDHQFLTLNGWNESVNLLNIPLFLTDYFDKDINGINNRYDLEHLILSSGINLYNKKNIKVIKIIENGIQEVFCPIVETGCFLLFDQIVTSNSDAISYYIQSEYPVGVEDDLDDGEMEGH